MPNQDESGAPVRLQGKYAAIVVCWLLGNGCLFSWNSMLTIEDYYAYLFPKYHPSRVLTLVYQPFALGTLAILAYNEAKINTRWRNLFGYTLFFISTLLVLVLDLATSGRGGFGTYIGICVISAAFGVADANVQGGMVGDLSFMLPELIQVDFSVADLFWFKFSSLFLAGLAASGALTSALRLITKAAFQNSKDGLRKGAILFFAISSIFELLLRRDQRPVSSDLAAGGICTKPGETNHNPNDLERLSNKELLFQNIDYALDMFLIYALTLSIFPGFLSEDTGSHSLGGWYSLVLIAMYNVWDLIGRYVPLVKCIKLESRRGLMIAILLRSLFIPAFYFTAKYGDQGWMIMLTSFLGVSHGYLTVCVLTSAPRGYKGPEQNALGNILVLFLLGGLFAGVTLDWLWLIGKGW
ncbi:Equilibrative nucleotide transporter 3 [Abeliophyllum distichum]|uniref:Equilibrative nucleotide transporter 3 n=1 Tax=Abeliophyllum distichum TaxID=126358 RepID=A0ABD1QKQ0_9LAMI